MLNTGNKTYYNVKGIQINDPSINYDDVMQEGRWKADEVANDEANGKQLLLFGT